MIAASDQQPRTRSTSPQELREMVKLPDTRPEMLAADFEGVAEALKGKDTRFVLQLGPLLSVFPSQDVSILVFNLNWLQCQYSQHHTMLTRIINAAYVL